MLRNTGLLKFAREGNDNRQWRHVPQDEEESWHLQPWEEEEDEQHTQ